MKNFKIKSKLYVLCVAAILLTFLFGAFFVSNKTQNAQNNNLTVAINYGNTSDIVKSLIGAPRPTESYYDLSFKYPVLAENQTSSNFCWTYASAKALETAMMVQSEEYHNFSDVGMALLAYNFGIKNIFNAEGNFADFCNVMQTVGVVYENDFSNDEFLDIDGRVTEADKYSFVNDYADKTLSDSVLPICLGDDTNYVGLDLLSKRLLVQNYIKKYGGLFAGLERGTYSSMGQSVGKYEPLNNTSGSGSYDAIYKSQNHAVCIIGWDDEYGWLAINSWGVENSFYEKFYIPYNYTYTYNTFSGFECQDGEAVKTSDSSSISGISNGLKNFNKLVNVFEFGQDIEFEFKFGESVDFSSVYFSAYHGKQDVSRQVEANFEDSTKTTKLKLPLSNQQSGTYLIKFYSGSKLIGTKELLVHSGTEIAYIKFSADKSSADTDISEDTPVLMSTHSSSENSATFYVDIKKYNSFNLNLYKNDLSSNNISLVLDDVYLTYMEGSEVKSEIVSNKYNAYITNFGKIKFNFASGENPENKMIEFKIIISSKTGMPQRELFIKIIVSSPEAEIATRTSEAFAIEYVLGGGVNDSRNIQRFPNYSKDPLMTSFKVYPATKLGNDFAGWYTDPDFENEFALDVIDASLPKQILVLYAKWSSTETEYFDGLLEISDVVDYNKEQKDLSQSIIYGDSVKLLYDFQEKPALSGTNYIVNYNYYINGKETDKNDSAVLDFKFPNLTFGNYEIKVVVNVIISRQFSVTKEGSFNFNVQKKQTTANFNELSHQFDGKPHQPSSPVFDGVYAEDLENMLYTFNKGAEINVAQNGHYEFELVALSNKNYELVGNKIFNYQILPRELVVNWTGLKQTYNGTPRIPDVELKQKDDGMFPISPVNASVLIYDDEEWKNMGVINASTYSVKLSALSSRNYVVKTDLEQSFVIEPAKLKIKINDVSERLQTATNYRKELSYVVVSGSVFGNDDLGIKLSSEGLTATVSGNYDINVSHTNKNYELSFEKGTYTLLGTYTVFYKLPNGEIYEEVLTDGETPKGITSDIYKLPFLSVFSYNQPLEFTGDDLYISVSIINYTWVVVILIVIIVFIVVYAVVTHKVRKNKVR